MKTIRIIVTVLILSVMYQFAAAQNACPTGKYRMVKGSYKCGCHCQKKCVAAQDTAAYKANYWYFGTECWGNCCWVRAGENLSIETSFEEIYPNPSSGFVSIAFTLSQPSEVTLEVIDVTGRYVTTIAHAVFEEAGNVLTWDVSPLTRGIYFLRMKAGSYRAVKRISVLNDAVR